MSMKKVHKACRGVEPTQRLSGQRDCGEPPDAAVVVDGNIQISLTHGLVYPRPSMYGI